MCTSARGMEACEVHTDAALHTRVHRTSLWRPLPATHLAVLLRQPAVQRVVLLNRRDHRATCQQVLGQVARAWPNLEDEGTVAVISRSITRPTDIPSAAWTQPGPVCYPCKPSNPADRGPWGGSHRQPRAGRAHPHGRCCPSPTRHPTHVAASCRPHACLRPEPQHARPRPVRQYDSPYSASRCPCLCPSRVRNARELLPVRARAVHRDPACAASQGRPHSARSTRLTGPAPRGAALLPTRPRPGPTSSTLSPGPTAAAATMSRSTLSSVTKFWPSDLRGGTCSAAHEPKTPKPRKFSALRLCYTRAVWSCQRQQRNHRRISVSGGLRASHPVVHMNARYTVLVPG